MYFQLTLSIWRMACPQTTQTAHTLDLDLAEQAYSVPTRHATVPYNIFWLTSNGHLLQSGVKFYNLERNTPILNIKHNVYEFCLFLKILHFLFKGSLIIPEYRCLLIGRVQYLYTIEHAVENIANYRCYSISGHTCPTYII